MAINFPNSPSNGDTYTYSGRTWKFTTGKGWEAFGSEAAGPQGPQGAVGPQGTNGTNGSQGPQGSPGPQGAAGAQGAAGTNGTNGAQGPQGVPGTNGSNGAQGPQGAQGAAGPQGFQGAAGAQMVSFSHDDLTSVPIPYNASVVTLKSVTIPANTLQAGSRIAVGGRATGVPGGLTGPLTAVLQIADPDFGFAIDVDGVGSVSAFVEKTGTTHALRLEGEVVSSGAPGVWLPIDVTAPCVISFACCASDPADDDLADASDFVVRIFGATAAAASVVSVTGPQGAPGAVPAWVPVTISVSGVRGGQLEEREVITDATVTTSSVIDLKLAPTLNTDENDLEMMDLQTLAAIPGTGSFEVIATFTSRMSGPLKLQYQVN